MSFGPMRLPYASALRGEIIARNAAFAKLGRLLSTESYGSLPVIVYEPYADGTLHGNFIDASYAAILQNESWRRRLTKVHTQAARSLPKRDRRWMELDSCTSSDALLMNIFCYPDVPSMVGGMLGVDTPEVPVFGFKPKVPLANGRLDRTEVDMKLGNLLVESKLTESDFQVKDAKTVEAYRDFAEVFDPRMLPRERDQYRSYQLIRNVLAAHAIGSNFCVCLDARRSDLLEDWYAVMRCVQDTDLKTRCKVLSWQELSRGLPAELQMFLDLKYGIVPPGQLPSPFPGFDPTDD